jgi:hypothetical protein
LVGYIYVSPDIHITASPLLPRLGHKGDIHKIHNTSIDFVMISSCPKKKFT